MNDEFQPVYERVIARRIQCSCGHDEYGSWKFPKEGITKKGKFEWACPNCNAIYVIGEEYDGEILTIKRKGV